MDEIKDKTGTYLVLEIIDYNKKLLIKKVELKLENVILDVNGKILTININNFPKNVDDYYVENLILYYEEKKKKKKLIIDYV